MVKPVAAATPNLCGVWTLGSGAIISLILQGDKLRLRDVRKSAKITQLVGGRTGIQSQSVSPSLCS